ncbi:respiratory chain complex I subunit 1 family protein [Ferrimicrobium acidiphilum]|uniref:respiratory chain complex I subunit 1 family protein n=1 Tax=Ferrimicrobium acidiphilum TaxID=121039 RepID=UPI0023F18582|nr:NADH-quinone oxidoreductase subunit H [Ferrimicrobium acidiphilum]
MSDVLLQIGQVLTILLLSPLIHGFIVFAEERVQGNRGPSILQPYRDLWKYFHKEQLVPDSASFIFWLTPIVAFVAMMIVPMLIPVLTNFPLPLSNIGDILGGGLILTLAAFFISLSALDAGHPFGGMGSSRESILAILAEPSLIMVFIGITLLAESMLPFVVNHLLVTSLATYLSPAHLFFVAAFLILLTVETERLPIHSSIHYEVYMIGEARVLEYSGPMLGLLRWSSWMKQAILYTIFLNVLAIPWGLSSTGSLPSVLLSAVVLVGKWLIVAVIMVVIETVQSRLRFFRYQEPLALALVLAVLAVVARQVL